MIKKQVNWQAEKFSFSSDMSKNQIYQNLRNELKSLFQNGWEVISQEVAGYDTSNGDVVIVLGLAKYEYESEPAPSVEVKLDASALEEKTTSKRGRPAKEDK